jgi:integrase
MANKGGRRQFGSIRKRPSGRWQVRYMVDGAVHSAPMTYASKADAQAFLATVQADLVRGSWQAPRLVTEPVAEYVDRWIDEHPGLKETTCALYRSQLSNHIAGTALGRTPLCDVTPDLVRTWHAELRTSLAKRAQERSEAMAAKQREPSPATKSDGSVAAAQTYRLLRAALTTASEDGLIPRNPCQIKGAGNSRASERPTATPAEVSQLAEAVPARYRALVLMAAWTGARLGELAALRRADVDLEDATFSIRERVYQLKGRMDFDVPKSRASVRVITLPPHLVPILKAHLDEFTGPEPDALVFCTSGGRPLNKSQMHPMWARARAKVGRDDLRFHDLRHTGQTLAALAGATEAELMQRMGHSTTSASRIYMHSTTDHSRAVAAALSELAQADNVVPLRPVRRRSTATGD